MVGFLDNLLAKTRELQNLFIRNQKMLFMPPKYGLDKIKFVTNPSTFEKAIDLYESGKVTRFEEGISSYSAIVLGTKPYRVSVETRRYDYGDCECYLGQQEVLCKHMVAVAIYAVTGGKPLTEKDKKVIGGPVCSSRLGSLNKPGLAETKKAITAAMRYIKSYEGPSRIWFSYQNSLSEGCNRLAAIVSELPVGEQTAQLLVDMLLRLDNKLQMGGVDDSDGTVGGFIEETVNVLKEYVKLDPACKQSFHALENRETCFDWEKPLVELAN